MSFLIRSECCFELSKQFGFLDVLHRIIINKLSEPEPSPEPPPPPQGKTENQIENN